MDISLTTNAPVPCCCAGSLQCAITYDWAGTGMFDLDTGTTFLGASIGFACPGGAYMNWVTGDDTGQNGHEEVDIRVDDAHAAHAWSSSVTIGLRAGWYTPAGGSGNCTVTVVYNGVTRSKTISPGTQVTCASTDVGTVTIYDDGHFTLS